MRTLVVLLTAGLLLAPFSAEAQDGRATLEAAAKALGATDLKSIEIQGGGVFFWAGQSQTPGMAWPQFNVRSFTRLVNYETASLRDEMVRTRRSSRAVGWAVRPRRAHGGRRRQRRSRVERDGKRCPGADRARRPSVPALVDTPRRHQGRDSEPHREPGARDRVRCSRAVQGDGIPRRGQPRRAGRGDGGQPVLGDMPVTVSYADYRDFGGVKFPRRSGRRMAASSARAHGDGGPSDAAADIKVPDNVGRRASLHRVQSQKARGRSVVRDRGPALQRGDRDGDHRSWPRARSMTTCPGRHGRGAQAGAGKRLSISLSAMTISTTPAGSAPSPVRA